MPTRKLLISIKELQQAFEQLPVSGHQQRTIVLPIEIADQPAARLRFEWDYNQEQWQLTADNLIITPTSIL